MEETDTENAAHGESASNADTVVISDNSKAIADWADDHTSEPLTLDDCFDRLEATVEEPPDHYGEAEGFLRWVHPHDETHVSICALMPLEEKRDFTGHLYKTVSEASDAIGLCGKAYAVWTSVHQARSDVDRDTVNTKQKGKPNADQIAAYQFLAIDIDNEPAITGTCATDTERQHVREVAEKIRASLAQYDLPTPAMISTGNGFLLMYPINLPHTPASRELMQRLNTVLSAVFSTTGANVDPAVTGDPARILGVVGTLNRNKAEHQPDRLAHVREVVGELPEREPMSEADFRAWAEGYIREHDALSDIYTTAPLVAPVANLGHVAPPVALSAHPSEQAQRMQRAAVYLAKCDPAVEGHGGDRHTFNIAGHLLAFGLSVSDVHSLMVGSEWNARCSPPWASDELFAKVKSADKNGTPRQYKGDPTPATDGGMKSWISSTGKGDRSYLMSDTGNADLFVYTHGDDCRYVVAWRQWIIWDGRRWKRDTTDRVRAWACKLVKGKMYDVAKAIADDSARQSYTKHVMKSQSAERINAMVSLAGTHLAIDPVVLDQGRHLFNVANGTIDLQSMQLRDHRREDYITKLSPVTFDTGASCPTWDKFIARIFQDLSGETRADLVGYVQRASGYSMTGDVSEQCLFILHGIGRNGKTTFLNLLQYVMGASEYALTGQQQLLMKQQKSNSEDVVNLFGVRLAMVSETNEGQSFDESLVKTLTGGGRIRARGLYEKSFEFDPTHKIWMDCNHLPKIHSTDLGIWRRVKRIPFDVSITEQERDYHLEDKLRAEASGILNWMLAGLAQWRANGLQEPQCVMDAVKSYRSDNDVIATFLAECTEDDYTASVGSSQLYLQYKQWCDTNGFKPLSSMKLSGKLTERGYEKWRDMSGVRFRGLTLADKEPEDAEISWK